jgi:hypothetical protein
MFPSKYLLALLAFSISPLINVAHALPKARIPRFQASKPRETRVPVFGFLLQGGVVNHLEGDVRCECAGIGGERVQKGRELVNGDLLKTGMDARAEILLNPGYYLRLGPNSRLALQDLSRNNLKVKLESGTALLEVLINDSRAGYTYPGTSKIGTSSKIYEFVTVITPNYEYLIGEGGAYRFAAEGNAVSSVKVIGGHIAIAGEIIGEGFTSSIHSGVPTTAKSDLMEDKFEQWSRSRAASLVEVNKSLKQTTWHKQLEKNWRSFFDITDEEQLARQRAFMVVQASGGWVSLAEQGVIRREGTAEWQKVSEGDHLEYNQEVKTAKGSRAEILLFPNCVLHLAGDSDLVYSELKGGGALVDLRKGSAIVVSEIGASDQARIAFATPNGASELIKEGVYRFNTVSPEQSELIVSKGMVNLAEGDLKSGHKAVFQQGRTAVEQTKSLKQDSFDIWSSKRATSYGAGQRGTGALFQRFETMRAQFGGMWYFETSRNEHTFVPGFWEFHSPYGGRYNVGFRVGFGRR